MYKGQHTVDDRLFDAGRPSVIQSAKELVDRFYGLPLSAKAQLIERFGLLQPRDLSLTDSEQLNVALIRARDSGQLLALARAIVDLGG